MNLVEINVFCVSLQDSAERCGRIKSMADEHALDIQFIDAFDGQYGSREDVRSRAELAIQWEELAGLRDEIGFPLKLPAASVISRHGVKRSRMAWIMRSLLKMMWLWGGQAGWLSPGWRISSTSLPGQAWMRGARCKGLCAGPRPTI